MRVLLFFLLLPSLASASLVETIQTGKLDESRLEVILPSDILKELSRWSTNADRRKTLVDRAKARFAGSISAEALDQLTVRAERVLRDKNAQELDQFPTLPIEAIPALQQGLYLAQGDTEWKLAKPALTVPVFRLDEACTPSSVEHKTVVKELYIQSTSEPIDQAAERCYAANSEALSTTLNALAEKPNEYTVIFQDGMRKTEHKLRGNRDLLEAFSKEGFQTEIYVKRTLVDFLGDTFASPLRKDPKHIRLVLWIRVPLPNGERLSVPAEHGDFGILFTRDGKNRFAESRYFIGIPSPGQTAVSFWRPRSMKNAAWTASRVEFSKHYAKDKAVEAEPWLEAGATTLRAFRQIQNSFGFPAHAYGYYICNDSVALALAKYSKLVNLPHRLSRLFPLIRVSQLELPDRKKVPVDEDFATEMGLDNDFVRSLYPSDTALAADPEKLKARLLLAYPATDPGRLSYFPETVASFRTRLWEK